jgi:predicted ATPase
VKLLVTSREVLHLRAEHQFVTPPLALPTLQQSDSSALEENPAVQLFLQHAQAVQQAFRLTPGNAAIIAEICRRLEGIPLAIELAAPRLKLLSPQALLARLEGRLQVLTGGARDLPERQRTMRATIAWSYELLSPSEQALFRRVSVFVEGWTLEAAERVCQGAGAPERDILENLGSLLDKSLVSQEPGSSGETRFKMLYVLREFGLEQLDADGEATATREAHAAYYLALAEEAHPQQDRAESKGGRGGLVPEHDNLRAALNWWLEHAEQARAPEAAERALRLWWAMSPFWIASCYREGYANVQRVLAVRAGVAEPVQVKALLYAASVLRAVDEVEQAQALAQEALALARQTGDIPGIAFALLHLGVA